MPGARFTFSISDSMRAFHFSNMALRLGYADGPSAHHPISAGNPICDIARS